MDELTCNQLILLLKIHKGWIPFKGIIAEEEQSALRKLIKEGLIERNPKFRPKLDFEYSTTELGGKRAKLALLKF